jgi:hypothetical protein
MHKYQKSKSRQKTEQDKLRPASESPFRKERTEKEIARVVMPRRWKALPATGAVAALIAERDERDHELAEQIIIRRDSRTGRIPRQILRKGKLVNDQTWKQQVVGGMWVNWIQKGMDPEAWGELFNGEKRCLIRREERTPRNWPPANKERTRRESDVDAKS